MRKLSILLPTIILLCFSGHSFCQVPTKATSVSKDYLSKELLMEIADTSAAPFTSLKTLAFENVSVANDLENYVGRIVRVSTAADGKENVDFMVNLVADTVNLKVVTPSRPTIDFRHISKERIGEISFLGISAGLDTKDLYEYNSTTSAISSVLDRQIDKSKIPTSARCANVSNCEYYYINSAAVQTITLMMLKTSSKNVKVKNLPLPVALQSLGGSYYVGNRDELKNVRNFVFLTLIRLPE